MRCPKNTSLKFKLTLSTVILILFPMLIAIIYNIITFTSKSDKETKLLLKNRTIAANLTFNAEKDKINHIAKMAASDPSLILSLSFFIPTQTKDAII